MKKQIKSITVLVIIFLMVLNFIPTQVDAHRAYFLQVLIDEGQLQYISNIVKDSTILEGNKMEAELWNYNGSFSQNYSNFEGKSEKDALHFNFPSKKLGTGFAENNATSKDSDRAYKIAETLVPNMNELLIIMNGNKGFDDIDEFIAMSEELATKSQNGGNYNKNGVSISFKNGKAEVSNNGVKYEYLTRMVKGYNTNVLENGESSSLYSSGDYEDDTTYITMADMIAQANYRYKVKNQTSMDTEEYSNPGTLEIKLMELWSSLLNSLKSLLGLREINEVVFNEGIVGSGMYYNGLMPTSWFQKSMAFHMIFQAITWIALGIAIIKLLYQRNLATISSSSKIALQDGIRDLILAGFMLVGMFLVINLFGQLNGAIVNIFANTVPEYSESIDQGVQAGTLGGLIMQTYYFLITLYLNVIYIARAISLAIIFAIGPIFIGSIAFQTRNKDYFETWARMLVANIFVQSFHSFVLSFFLSIQMTTARGIEVAIISFALIPSTKLFKQIVTKNQGGLMETAGNSLGMAGAALGVGLGAMSRKIKGSSAGSKSDYKGSVASDSGGFSPAMAKEGISSRTPSSASSKEALNEMKSKPSGNMGKVNKSGGAELYKKERANKMFKGKKTLGKEDFGKMAKGAGKTAVKAGVGVGKLTAGVAAGMAFGGTNNISSLATGKMMGAGMSDIGSAGASAAKGTLGIAGSGINSLQSKSSLDEKTLLGAEQLSNGNVAIHRDKEKLNDLGLEESRMTEDNNLELTYDTSKLTSTDKGNISNIRQKYMNGETDELADKGIAGVYDSPNGNVSVQYNDYGKEKLGYQKAYTTEDTIVEVKKAGSPVKSNLTYDVNEAKDNSGRQEQYNQYENRDIYDGPTDGGQSLESGPPNIDLDNML